MTALLAAILGAGAVAALTLGDPTPARCRSLATGSGGAGERRTEVGASAWLGRRARHLPLVRDVLRLDDAPGADRRRGRTLVATVVVAATVGAVPAVSVAAALLLGQRWRRVRLAGAGAGPQERAVTRDLPELVDLLTLAVGAGLTLPAALGVLRRTAPASVRDDLAGVVDAVDAGRRLEPAVAHLASRWGEPGQPLVHAMVDHLRYGTPLLPALDRVATESRARRRRAAEIRARRLPVLLLFPLVLCTLPAFGLLTVAPLVAGTLGSLEGSPLEAPASTAP